MVEEIKYESVDTPADVKDFTIGKLRPTQKNIADSEILELLCEHPILNGAQRYQYCDLEITGANNA